jgi:hypothetical protein
MTMTKTMMFSLAGLLAISSTAIAQPVDGELPPTVGDQPPPPPEPVVAPQPPQPPVVVQAPVVAEPSGARPQGTALGIGAGYTLPTSIQTPNTTSARLRLGSGLTFEPRVVLSNTTTTQETDVSETSTSTRNLSVGTLVRYPLVERGKFDLLLLGALAVGTETTDPDGADNNTTNTSLTVGWGAAVDWWITQHWNVSFSATNALFGLTKTSNEMPAPVGDSSSTTTGVGAIWNPTISVMIHLYN